MKNNIAFFVFIAFVVAAAANAEDFLSTEDLRAQVELSALELSPDGKQMLILVSRQDFESNTFVDELLLIDVGTRKQRPLTQRAGISMATWSPEGDRVAFLADAEGTQQIFILSMRGGEPLQITSSKGGILHYSWSPDGKRFAFVLAATRKTC